MSEVLGNIYDRSVAIVFGTVVIGTVFFSTLEIVETCFLTKNFQNLLLVFSFYPKNGRTGSRKTSLTEAWSQKAARPLIG